MKLVVVLPWIVGSPTGIASPIFWVCDASMTRLLGVGGFNFGWRRGPAENHWRVECDKVGIVRVEGHNRSGIHRFS